MQVCGVHGSWHLGQLQIGLSRPIKLAQCRSARITLLEAIPVQMDGEPWHQPPATLDVSLHGQVPSALLPVSAATPAGLCITASPVLALTVHMPTCNLLKQPETATASRHISRAHKPFQPRRSDGRAEWKWC